MNARENRMTLDALKAALLAAILGCALMALGAAPAMAHAHEGSLEAQEAGAATQMHRLYNPYSGEHFYTADANEKASLVKIGWSYEGVGWYAPKAGADVHRLYNPYSGDHHFTTSASERDACVRAGWRSEGVGWKSGGTVKVYREYNPYAPAFYHNYTAAANEHSHLCSIGWKDEGVGWHGVAHEHAWQAVTKQVTTNETYEVVIVKPAEYDTASAAVWRQVYGDVPYFEFANDAEALAFESEAIQNGCNPASAVIWKTRPVTKTVTTGYRCTGCGATK